jgi:hypothetical protein
MTVSRNLTRSAKCVIAYCFIAALAWSQQPADNLRIIVIAGDQGANILKGKVAVRPVVEVRDRWSVPIAGAKVTFDLPGGKPGVRFVNGKRDASVITDINGRATAGALKPIGKGQFEIGISASYHGDTAIKRIMQTNYGTAESARGPVKLPGPYANAMSGTTKALAVVGVVAAGAAIGAAAAESKKQGPNCTSQLNQANSAISVAAHDPFPSAQWLIDTQAAFGALGSYCSCAGGIGQLDSTSQSEVRTLLSDGSRAGFVTPASCGSF